MNPVTLFKIAGLAFKFRRFIALAVVLEFILRRATNKDSKKQPTISNDELKSFAEDAIGRAQQFLQDARKRV